MKTLQRADGVKTASSMIRGLLLGIDQAIPNETERAKVEEYDYKMYQDGWHQDPALPIRLFLVINKSLLDSCYFRNVKETEVFIAMLRLGKRPQVAYLAARTR